MICPICQSLDTRLFDQDKFRSYLQCQTCEIIFVPRDLLISKEKEIQRYEAHENHETDPHYQQYLLQVMEATLPWLKKGQVGLDFGCGKATLLAKLYEHCGISVDSYDIHFHPENEIWEKKYNFIILSEVIEHLHKPLLIMKQLKGLLYPGGQLFIKTKLAPLTKSEFGQWFYKRDPTHIQFFNHKSFHVLAELLHMTGPHDLEKHDLFRFC